MNDLLPKLIRQEVEAKTDKFREEKSQYGIQSCKLD